MLRYALWSVVAVVWATAPSGCSCSSDTDTGLLGADAGGDSGGMATDGTVPGTDGGPGVDGTIPGVDGAMCPDADGDGHTECTDCDDTLATVYPGAPEVCGDGLTNDCDSTSPPDTGCGGIGTYVAPPPRGSDSNPGTQASPVETIAQGMTNAMTIGGGQDVYVAAGTYGEDIAMVEGISLLGGHESTGWTRDPAANVTTIRSTTASGVFFNHGITRATAIDGFTIEGRSGLSSAAAVTVAADSSPEITNNVIAGPNASGASTGVDVNQGNTPPASSGTPLIRGNAIRLGTSGGGWGGGNGGWGIRARRTAAEIVGNQVTLANDDTIQRGIEVGQAPAGTLVEGNVVRGGGRADFALGIAFFGGAGVVRANDVSVGDAFTGGQGITVAGELSGVEVVNNVAFGAERGSGRSMGLAIQFERVPSVRDVLVHSNFFHGGGANESMGVLFGEMPTTPFVVGRLYNNIIYAGDGPNRYAVFEQHPNIDPELFHNNALHVDRSGSVATGALYRDEGAVNQSMITVINALPGFQRNLANDCDVRSPMPGGDFHLDPGSMCIDAGSSAELPPTDYEGDARPAGTGPDIGVDEAG